MASQALAQLPTPSGRALGDAVADVAAGVRENVVLRRGARLDAGPRGVLAAYVHGGGGGGGAGTAAALVALRSACGGTLGGAAAGAAADLGRKLAMHVVAARPL